MDPSAYLANQDIAGFNSFSAISLDTAPLCIAVASVFGTPGCFFMSHV
jgi:hypothetical protein